MKTYILGLSAYYHDSAAALVCDGEVVAAAQEERFTRKKHDPAFPAHAIKYCLKEAGITHNDISSVVFYDKPLLKFERLLETYLSYAPSGFRSFLTAMPIWLKDKLFLKKTLKRELSSVFSIGENEIPELLFNEHHQSHAASAFFPSPYEKAAVLCLDGVGEWATTSMWIGDGNELTPQWEIDFPHSLGLLYSAFTYYTGFRVNSGEYKLMGLAPYGEPKYVDLILDNLIDLKEDGTFKLNMKYFNYATGLTMTNKKFADLFGAPARQPEGELTQKEMDIARSIQWVTEEVVLRLGRSVHKETGLDYLCLAGGVALNCVSNGRLLREGPFKGIWIQPAAGDAGGAVGAALSAYHQYMDKPRTLQLPDATKGSYLGPKFSNEQITSYLDKIGADYTHVEDDQLMPKLAEVMQGEKVVGWFQGRMEFGPRSLGARSIIGDARSTKMQTVMNLKIKYRESFRPFAPVVKFDKVSEWFEHEGPSPYMLIVAPVKEDKRNVMSAEQDKLFGIDKLNIPRSQIPAVTHVDYSARVQTVHPETNPRFYHLLDAFEEKTGCPVLVNTSFNVRGEPIVNTPEDAYRCFMRTEMDYLVMENILIDKTTQPEWKEEGDWRNEFALD
ncbi:carbamoyltransferase [Cocleimonas sp. KMM 6892]|uniref:carbamoyltransferase family protein n=1 Tax=unclassified Cocleimonas TaxID=2639732 RepID=UPI002DBC2494|nr:MULTISPECIES: carbamoyltransferase [unclassified Cocleimonas]MEB8431497.1 carbamoyltransferase [Cocleimonas sp. KMM 6892]MEC4713731.1 carbamoyltransferase [Cocleimonas sp. KMM 6895]MEC4743062.1 carbamoyltransferase [Cocleimonas sp. KMM 6896]